MKAKLKENIVALVIAVLLAGGVIIAINNSGTNLATDVLGVKKQQDVSDLKLVKKGDVIELVSNKNIEDVASLSLELVFNPDKVKLKKENIQSDYDLVSSLQEGGNSYNILIQDIKSIKKGNVLFKITDVKNVNLSDINVGHVNVISNTGIGIDLKITK